MDERRFKGLRLFPSQNVQTLAVWRKDELSSAVNIFGRCLKMIILSTSSYKKQQLLAIVTICGPATTIQILLRLIGVAAGPSVPIPLSHLLVNM